MHPFCDTWPAFDAATPQGGLLVVAGDLRLVTPEPALMDGAERVRAARLRGEMLQRRFLAAHTLLRRVLGWYLGRDPAAVDLVNDPQGKPHLADDAVRFNLSHGEEAALVVVGSPARLGIDVERLDRLRDVARLAERMLAPVEFTAFRTLPDETRNVALLRTWTRKEAVLKAIGAGLPGGMEHVVLAEGPLRVIGDHHRLPALADLRLMDLPVSAGYAAALCHAGAAPPPLLRRWSGAGPAG